MLNHKLNKQRNFIYNKYLMRYGELPNHIRELHMDGVDSETIKSMFSDSLTYKGELVEMIDFICRTF